jgi:hypothetical protein
MSRVPAILAAALLAAGCAGGRKTGDIPETHPVKGKVIDAKGNPLKGGAVQFELDQPADMTIVGSIENDGTYSLKTIRDKSESPGAPPGEYQVVVTLPIGTDGNAPPPPVTLSKKFKVEAKENTLDIDLKKP